MPQVPSSLPEDQLKAIGEIVKACPRCVDLNILVFAGQWTCGRCGHDFTEPAYWQRVKSEDAPAEHGWQPINTAPKDGSYVLASWLGGDLVIIASFTDRSGMGTACWRHVYGSAVLTPTHWMPLPKGPTT